MKRILAAISSLLLTLSLHSQSDSYGYAYESALSSGKWHKLYITEDGVYRIGYTRLKELGFTDPGKVRIFGNNTGQLSYYNDDPRPDDLKEIPIETVKGPDGIFNDGDYLYFFGQGTHRWKYDGVADKYHYSRHNYSDTAVYFITSIDGVPSGIQSLPVVQGTADYITGAYDALYVKEEETESLIRSGREWYQPVSVLKGIDINPGFTGMIDGEPVVYRLRVAGRSGVPSMFRIVAQEETLVSVMVPEVNMFNTTGTYARYAESEGTLPYNASPRYEVRFFNNGESGARGWLDYVWLRGRSMLTAGEKTLVFSDSRSVGPGLINEYTIKSTLSDLIIWDVTDPGNPTAVATTFDGSNVRFRAEADSLRRFAAFRRGSVQVPSIKALPEKNQNLHGTGPCDMLIVVHPWFIKYAERVAAIHFENSGLISKIVTPAEIYNEFSGGIYDISAIRNYVRMVWLRHAGTQNPLKYLLLFGDGSFENRVMPPANPNFIPTWQTQNSNIIVSSFMSDDFYGLLGPGEGEANGFLDIGIGRLPAYDTISAAVLVDKIDRYINESDPGQWRNLVAFAADDEDGNLHMSDAENIVSFLSTVNPTVNVDKIYFDAFKQVTSVNGQTYPDATRAVNNRIEQGALIFNYLGHGNELGLAHERVVRTVDINSWKNISRLSLFVTATCEFSRFDDVEYNIITGTWIPKTSAGELALLNPAGGAIALMSTTRVVFSAPNFILNRNIYNYAFSTDSNGEPLRLGDIIRLAKVSSGSGNNKRNFSLLGDPALRLAYPSQGIVVTDSINHRHISQNTDTLKALSEVTISGHVKDQHGELMDSFNGTLFTTVYDKPVTVTTLANDGGLKMDFDLLTSVIFSGKTTVSGGKFSIRFLVPRDIDYTYGEGKISYYAHNGEMHAAGHFSDVTIGGFSTVFANDTTGPLIKLFLNDTLFRAGGLSGSEPLLFAILSDDNGINTTGAGIGHDITLWLNDDKNGSVVVNNYFEADFDNYRRGSVMYPLGVLKKGANSVTLKAWDNYNNSSEETLHFIVGDDIKFIISDILNYPNPFTTATTITAGHNRPDDRIDVEIAIYDLSGRQINILRTVNEGGGFNIQPVEWDRTDGDGSRVSRGIYIYTITLRAGSDEVARGTGRMIIL